VQLPRCGPEPCLHGMLGYLCEESEGMEQSRRLCQIRLHMMGDHDSEQCNLATVVTQKAHHFLSQCSNVVSLHGRCNLHAREML
jgi:hypothetical protein